jgi:hypothetical protein
MKHNHDNRAENAELDASLKRLGIRELEERMEVAPLLMEDGTGAGAGEVVDDSFMEMCCVCRRQRQMIGRLSNRRSRPGSPRRSGPGGRAGCPAHHENDLAWDLWNFRALFPDAGRADLLAVKKKMDAHLAREREALAGLWAGDRSILSPGHGFLDGNPDLKSGIVCSLHQGPYQLMAEPFVCRGLDPALLLNRQAMESFKVGTDAVLRKLGYARGIEWIPVDDGPFLKKALRVLREGRPLLVYLDGNTGAQGMDGTRARGLRYRLPGRDIRVRTGLARLAVRMGVPVHRVALAWKNDGEISWERDATLRWTKRDDPDRAARTLYDWCFSHIMRRPEQWQYWGMLKKSSACFTTTGFEDDRVPTGLRDDFKRAFTSCLDSSPRTVRLILEKSVAVWPGEVLADLSEDRFYPSAGLRDEDLEPLRDGHPTLGELIEFHGEEWVRFHGLRLCLLGMARLGG